MSTVAATTPWVTPQKTRCRVGDSVVPEQSMSTTSDAESDEVVKKMTTMRMAMTETNVARG